MEVLTVQFDTVEGVLWRYLGTTDPVEEVLEANRHLRRYGASLPAGVRIVLPDTKTTPKQKKVVKLWD